MLTLQQLYNLGTSESVNIFEYLTLPSGSPFNKELVINTILVKCGLNIPMYADPYTMRSAIDIWSKKNQYTFEHIAKIYTADYSPIENTDRYESITVDRKRDLDDKTAVSNTKKENLNTSSNTANEGSSNYSGSSTHTGTDTTTIEETISAENVSDYQPDKKTTNTLLHGETVTDSNTSNTTDTTNTTGTSNKNTNVNTTSNKDVDEAEKTTTTQHTHGNIGTTTNTTLQVEEYKLMADYNPYNFIAGLFENELTLCVY